MTKQKKLGKKLKEFSFETRYKSVNEYKERLLGMFKAYVKAIIMFGSITRNEQHGKSDVDIYMIFDDTKLPLKKFEEIRDKVTDDMYKVARQIDPRLHPQPVIALTEFWDGMRRSNPVFYTLTRDGYAVYDAGFFIPMRKLLEQGKFPGTKESAYLRMESVPKRLERVKDVKKLMIAEDIYYSMLDAAQAILMYVGVGQPSPGQAANELRKNLVANKLLDEKYAKMMEEVYAFRKKVEYKEFMDEVSGKEVDEWIKKAGDYVDTMTKLLKKLEDLRKEEDIKTNYEIMLKASIAALKSINKLPEDPKELPDAFKKYLVESGRLNQHYAEIFEKVVEMRKHLDEKKLEDIPDKDVYTNKEYVRRFILELKRGLNKQPEEIEKEMAEEKLREAKAKVETAKEVEKLPENNIKKKGRKK
ncbi:MAG: nucleotidyltransferase domain-containing protein [Candidatus Aenigmarchaeota archaeon]|nr:nucleotidyltransferase domain-containing protein [Candidatus Aenigmarchaeota archaeon]